MKARAAGIYLVFAAQRPDANVMPMQLRANLGNRLVLRVDGEGTSDIALGEKGAERLLGKGHLAAKLEGETDYNLRASSVCRRILYPKHGESFDGLASLTKPVWTANPLSEHLFLFANRTN